MASAVFIALVARRLNWGGLAAVLSRVHVGMALTASVLTPVLILLLSVRWRIFLRQQSIAMPLRIVFPLTWAGQFFNSVLPGSTGGDVVKIYQLCRMFPEKKAAAAGSVIIDRLSALLALAVLAGIALMAGPGLNLSQLGLSPRAAWPWLIGLLAFSAIGFVLLLRIPSMPHWLGRLRHLFSVLSASFTLNGAMALAVAMAFTIHFVSFGGFFLFARALGIAVTYPQVLLFLPVVMTLLLIPVTVNGHGLREVLLIFYFTHFHIALSGYAGVGVKETVIALSVLAVSNDLMWSLPGGLWYLMRFKSIRV